MRPGVLYLRLAWFLLLFLSLLGGCKRSPTIAPAPSNERALVPVPPPEGLVSELFVPHPERTWDAVRASLGGTTPLLPTSAAVFLGATLELPVSTLDQLDLVVPIVGALVDVQDDIAAVVGIHVKDGSRFVELVTSGNPRFTKGDTQDGVLTLASSDARGGAFSYAVSGNYLVLSQNAEALRRFTPFVSRTLPSRPPPAEDIVVTASHRALSGPVIGRAKKLWNSWKHERGAEDLAMRAKHGGSAPDFGDPAQALADIDAMAAGFFSILDDLEEARLAVTVEPKSAAAAPSYRALVSLKPASDSGAAAQEIASMAVAGADPLLSLPAGVAVALMMRDTAEQREQSSSTRVEAISKVLGGRLQAEDKAKIAAAFQSWSKGRGNWLTAGLVWAGPTRAAVIRGAVADPAELSRGISAMLKLLSVRAIADPLSSWVGQMKISGIGAAGDGVVQTVHVVRRPPKTKPLRGDKPAPNDAFDIVWSIGKDLFVGAAGLDAKGVHAALETSSSSKTLAQEPFVERAVARLGPHVSFALLVDTAKLSDTGRPPPEGSAFLLTYGKDSQNHAWFEFDAPAAVVASYASLLGSLR